MDKKILLLLLLSSFLVSYAIDTSSQTNTIAQYPNFLNESYISIGKQTDLDYIIKIDKRGNYYENLIFALKSWSFSWGAYQMKARINILPNITKPIDGLVNLTIYGLTFQTNTTLTINGSFKFYKNYWNGSKFVDLPLYEYVLVNNSNMYFPSFNFTNLNISSDRIYLEITLIADSRVRIADSSYVIVKISSTKWKYTISTAPTTTTTTTIPPSYTCNQTGFWFKCMQSRVLTYVNNWNFTMKVYYNFSYPCDGYHNCLTYPYIYNNTFTYVGSFLFIKIPYFDGMSPYFSDLYFRAYSISDTSPCSGIIDNGRCLIDLGEIPFAIYNYSPREYAYIVLSNKTTLGSSYKYFYIFFNSPNMGFNNQSLLNSYFFAINVKNYSISDLGSPYLQIVVLKSPLVGDGAVITGWINYEGVPAINNNQYGNKYLGGQAYQYRSNNLVSESNAVVSSTYLDTIFIFYYNNIWDGRYVLSPHILINSKLNFYAVVGNAFENKTKAIQYNTGFSAETAYANVINANISFVSKPFANNVFISNQIENYLPYLNIKQVNITNLISKQGNQAINSFLAFVIVLFLAFIMKNEIIAILLVTLLFLFSLIFPNTLSVDLSTLALIIVLLYMMWKHGYG